ncbi:MAG: hypothetical protein QG594_1266 [Bacteroidota bacterium]|nr:hypothetical protein [Bacteroidota bacterium]
MIKKTFILLMFLLASKFAYSQQPYVGEVRLFAGNFAPNGWFFCDGQLLPISEYDTLFMLIGTTYGGDGQTTFALPDLRGRVPIGMGQGPGLSNRILGEKAGQETITLTTANMPQHNHEGRIVVSNTNATTQTPTTTTAIANSGTLSGRTYSSNLSYNTGGNNTTLQTVVTQSTGTSVPVKITKPSLGINYIISAFGIFPSPN